MQGETLHEMIRETGTSGMQWLVAGKVESKSRTLSQHRAGSASEIYPAAATSKLLSSPVPRQMFRLLNERRKVTEI